jgi:YesN/AraC family two-component response regulator
LTAGSAAEALALFAERPFDMVISDVSMPGARRLPADARDPGDAA